MCIRDRRRVGDRRSEGIDDFTVTQGGDDVHFARAAECRSPVSYTHLRAHETVLDLVCRLLLEKNNNTKTTIHIQFTINYKNLRYVIGTLTANSMMYKQE